MAEMIEANLTIEEARKKPDLWWMGYHAGELDEEYNEEFPEEWKKGYRQAVIHPFCGAEGQ